MSKRIEEFLGEVSRARNLEDLKGVCQRQLDYYRSNFELSTYRTYLTDCRNALREIDPNHKAIKYLILTFDEQRDFKKVQTERVYRKSGGLCSLNGEAFILKCEEMIKEKSYYRQALGLSGLTGRRISEVLVSSRFEVVDENHLLFSGQLKTKKAEGARTKPYVIPCLSSARKMVAVWREIRARKVFLGAREQDLDDIVQIVARAHTITAERHAELLVEYNDRITAIAEKCNGTVSKELSSIVKKEFAQIILKPQLLQAKSLRAAYALVAYDLFQDESFDKDSNFYFAQILGHLVGDLGTAQSYKIFYLEG